MGGHIALTIIVLGNTCPAITFQYWWRMNKTRSRFNILSKIMYTHYYRKMGIHMPSATDVGPGLVIWHPVGIVVNPKTRIGKNCNMYQFLSIGEEKGKAAVIGDNVTIGPHASIVGGVRIGNNVKIGAGTVVINDVPDNCTTVGNPNRIIFPKSN